MQTTLFILGWIVAALAVVVYAFYATRSERAEGGPIGGLPGGVKLIVGATAALALIAVPAIAVTSASDRLPSGAGTYTLESSSSEREGRVIFRETCASCHTLSAANARGVYGPNLDTIGLDAEGSEARIESAIENGGAAGTLMPKVLLEGEDAKLVSEYVAAVAGK